MCSKFHFDYTRLLETHSSFNGGGVVTQDTLDSLVHGREAQKSARKVLGKRKFANTLMVSTNVRNLTTSPVAE